MPTGSRIQITDRLALDSNLSYGGVTTQSNVALPISFQGAVRTTVVSQTITGGALGLNGYLEIKLGGTFAITANSVVAVTAYMDGVALTPTYTSPTFAASGGPYYLDGLVWVQNQNSEVTGVAATQFVWYDASVGTSGAIYDGTRRETSKAATDTSNDWTFSMDIVAADPSSGIAEISIARVNSYFIP